MTGIPDAETAWQKHPYSEPDGPAVDLAHAGFLAGFAAAEGPWREHLATQIEAATLNVDRVLAERAERMVALMDVKHQIVSIVRGTNE